MKTIQNKSISFWIIYYIFLGVIQALWTNTSIFPPTIFRIGMIFAVFAPIYLKHSLILLAIPFSIILRGNLSTEFQYLPDIYSYSFYIIIELSAIIFHHKKLNKNNLKTMTPIILLMLYMGFLDLIYNGELGPYTIHIFIAILLLPFIRNIQDFHILSASFVTVCCILSIYYIVMFDDFLVSWNKKEGLERSGWNDPNYFSTLLEYGFLASIIYLIGITKSSLWLFNKIILIGISIAIFIAVVMTASRAGFLCYLALLVTAFFNTKIKWYWYILGIGIVTATFFVMYNNGIFDLLLFRLFDEGNAESGGDRFDIWNIGLTNFNIQDFHALLFGKGYWHRIELSNGHDIHNEFLGILLDYGIVGTLLFSLFLISIISLTRSSFISRNITFIFYALCIISLSPFQYPYIGFLLIWIVMLKKFSFNFNFSQKYA